MFLSATLLKINGSYSFQLKKGFVVSPSDVTSSKTRPERETNNIKKVMLIRVLVIHTLHGWCHSLDESLSS